MLRRHITGAIRAALADTPVVFLSGARQTGKTTLVRDIATETSARYLTFDDATVAAAAAADPTGFLRNLDGLVILDEVQRVPAVLLAIKAAVDRDRRPGRFLLTGSANVMTLPRVAESLAGRMEVIPLYPFSAGELAGEREGFVARLFAGRVDSRAPQVEARDLAARLVVGGYPEATARRSSHRRDAWFSSYVSTLLQRDVRDLARVEALSALPNLLQLLAARTAGLLNVADLGRDARLPHSTLTRYLALLETLFLVYRLPAWSPNLGQRLVKAPKAHLIDTGLACHLLGAGAARLGADRQLLGRMLETYVVSELRKQASFSKLRLSLHHYRAAAGAEVDVVIEAADGWVAAVEVKTSATVGPGDFAALRSLRDRLGKQLRAGVVLYLGDATAAFGERLVVAPVSALWSA